MIMKAGTIERLQKLGRVKRVCVEPSQCEMVWSVIAVGNPEKWKGFTNIYKSKPDELGRYLMESLKDSGFDSIVDGTVRQIKQTPKAEVVRSSTPQALEYDWIYLMNPETNEFSILTLFNGEHVELKLPKMYFR